jgi:sporulation protein YlmC with PRC-barrel domain
VTGDPVSWLMIEPGWHVVDSAGKDVGRVEEVVGDSNADIFNGLAISKGLFSGNRYVPAEQVGAITEGRVELRLDHSDVERLDRYEQPPPSEEIVAPDPRR